MSYVSLIASRENKLGRALTQLETIDVIAEHRKLRRKKKEPFIIQNQLISSVTKFYGLSDLHYLTRRLNPSSQYQYGYVLLDTNNADADLSTDVKFAWRVLNYDSTSDGTVNVPSNTRDLVGMRIFPITMKLTTPVGEPDKTYFNNIITENSNYTVLIHEFQAQSYIGREGRKFHFVLFPYLMNPSTPKKGPAYTPGNPYIEFVTGGKANGWFWFRTPITEFSTMTVSIGNPFNLVTLSNTVRTLIPIQLIYLADKAGV